MKKLSNRLFAKKDSAENIFYVSVEIMLKKNILDPQGKVIEQTLRSLGFTDTQGVRMGKLIQLNIKGNNREDARKKAEAMCKKILVNSIIEEYRIKID